jgi:hypothetical protein
LDQKSVFFDKKPQNLTHINIFDYKTCTLDSHSKTTRMQSTHIFAKKKVNRIDVRIFSSKKTANCSAAKIANFTSASFCVFRLWWNQMNCWRNKVLIFGEKLFQNSSNNSLYNTNSNRLQKSNFRIVQKSPCIINI